MNLNLITLVLISVLCKQCSVQADCGDGDIRLAGGRTRFEGRIELCWDNVWGTVCDDSFLQQNTPENYAAFSTVVCRQLGFSSERATVATGIAGLTDTDNDEVFDLLPNSGSGVPIYLDDVFCDGNERGIIDCSHRGIGTSDCFHSEDTGIICSPGCLNDTIRLFNGPTHNSGIVELCHNQSLSTLHSNQSQDTMNIICKELGFSDKDALAIPSNILERGYGNILRANCTTGVFSDCSFIDIGSNYNHSDDLAIICQRCHDRCDTEPIRDTCPTETTEMYLETTGMNSTTESSTMDSSSASPLTTDRNENPTIGATESPVRRACSDGALGALVGVLGIALVAVVIGWIVTCIVLTKRKQLDIERLQRTNLYERTLENELYGKDIPADKEVQYDIVPPRKLDQALREQEYVNTSNFQRNTSGISFSNPSPQEPANNPLYESLDALDKEDKIPEGYGVVKNN